MKGQGTTESALISHPVLEMRQVSFAYERRVGLGEENRRSWVVRQCNLEVHRGEMLGVIGPNGSGKSSLLKLFAGLLHPQEGNVQLFAEDLKASSRPSVARQVAFMPQDVSFDFPFFVMDLVLMGRYPHRDRSVWNIVGWEQDDDVGVALQAMAMTDVTALADRAVDTLSAGERQRVLLARALAQQPRVLLLDEPTAHLDLNHQLDVCRILARVREHYGTTVVLVSHDINLASQYCDRILIMHQGRVVFVGIPQEVIHARNLKEIYGCEVLVDAHPHSGRPRVTMPGPSLS